MNKIRVLLADDHTIVREGLRLLLEREPDIQVVGEVENGEQAVTMANDISPDIIVMDINMPKLNGLEATRRIKAQKPSIGVLVLTVYDDDEYVFNLLKAGVTGYLLKKVASSQLANAIRAVHQGEMLLSPSIAQRVVEGYLHAPQATKGQSFSDGLTKRELEILRMIARGASNKEIATALYLSVKTVESHRTNIFRKLDIHDRSQAAAYAVRRGLVDD